MAVKIGARLMNIICDNCKYVSGFLTEFPCNRCVVIAINCFVPSNAALNSEELAATTANTASLPCPVCGSSMVYIRGRNLNSDKRLICPTCAVERLENISEIASPEYGKCKLAQQA